VIGNGQYKKAGLLNPINDANEIAKRFTQYGFTVKVVLDGDRKTLIKALGDFQAQSANYETNILFYAGHGIQFNGINYIIPTDMSLDAGSASIDFDAISNLNKSDGIISGTMMDALIHRATGKVVQLYADDKCLDWGMIILGTTECLLKIMDDILFLPKNLFPIFSAKHEPKNKVLLL
jgi:hypothetical protein